MWWSINCDWIYGNRPKLHIGSYEIIDFKDLKPAKDCEHAKETYTEIRPFYWFESFPIAAHRSCRQIT